MLKIQVFWYVVLSSGMWHCLLVCGSVFLGYLFLEDKNTALLENVWNHSTIQNHIPEDVISQYCCCNNLKFI